MGNESVLVNGTAISASCSLDEMKKNPLFSVLFENKKMAVLTSEPKTVSIFGGLCEVKMVFSGQKIFGIIAEPLVPELVYQEYPDEEEQRKKWNYSKKLLLNCYGKPDRETESEVIYEQPFGKVKSALILQGKGANTGGGIEIQFKR